MKKIPSAQKLVLAAGGCSVVAAKLKVSRQAVHGWRVVPAKRVRAFAKIANLPESAIRPDLYE